MRRRPLQINADGTAFVPLTRGLFAIIDAADAPLVAQYNWHAAWGKATSGVVTWSARTNAPNEKGGYKPLYLHTFLTSWSRVDHKDGNELNNRRSNLRPTSQQQNCFNRRKISKPTSSSHKGVSWNKHRSNWRSVICVSGKSKLLGNFKTELEAAEAYRKAASEMHGEFSVFKSRI